MNALTARGLLAPHYMPKCLTGEARSDWALLAVRGGARARVPRRPAQTASRRAIQPAIGVHEWLNGHILYVDGEMTAGV